MNNKKLIEETFKFISEFNPEHFSYSESVLTESSLTDFDYDGDYQPDMKDFAETVKKFMENLCNDEDK